MKICLDPGHGMANRRPGVYDPGAVAGEVSEAEVVLAWALELRCLLLRDGHQVVLTRSNDTDPVPVGRRTAIAREHGCDLLLSLHCNAFNGKARGTETFYRGAPNQVEAVRINRAVVSALGTTDRGAKTEASSQHSRLAVLGFPKAFLIELAFIDNPEDRALLLAPAKRCAACQSLAALFKPQ
jgi:N-acetylmuramoyl-L-alanine amidase